MRGEKEGKGEGECELNLAWPPILFRTNGIIGRGAAHYGSQAGGEMRQRAACGRGRAGWVGSYSCRFAPSGSEPVLLMIKDSDSLN